MPAPVAARIGDPAPLRVVRFLGAHTTDDGRHVVDLEVDDPANSIGVADPAGRVRRLVLADADCEATAMWVPAGGSTLVLVLEFVRQGEAQVVRLPIAAAPAEGIAA